MKSEFCDKKLLEALFYCLTPPNALVAEMCLATGLRIDDVLSIRTKELGRRMVIHEQKTHKKRTVSISEDLYRRLLGQAGKYYVFEHRTDQQKHRTRQAVYLDMKRAAKAFRLEINLSPHSLRKTYAVELYRRTGDITKVQKALNHDSDMVTMIYCFADCYNKKRRKKRTGS